MGPSGTHPVTCAERLKCCRQWSFSFEGKHRGSESRRGKHARRSQRGLCTPASHTSGTNAVLELAHEVMSGAIHRGIDAAREEHCWHRTRPGCATPVGVGCARHIALGRGGVFSDPCLEFASRLSSRITPAGKSARYGTGIPGKKPSDKWLYLRPVFRQRLRQTRVRSLSHYWCLLVSLPFFGDSLNYAG